MEKKVTNQKKRKGSLRTSILVRTLVPMLLMGAIFAVAAISAYQRFLVKELEEALKGVAKSVAASYETMVPGLYQTTGDTEPYKILKGDTEITGNYALIDAVAKESETEVSVIFGNVRVLTTLNNSHGERYINSGVNPAIVSDMEKNKAAIFHEVEIEGNAYYVCYIPIYNNDVYVGMVAAAKSVRDMKSERNAALFPILLITILCMLLASIISVTYTSGLLGDVRSMKKFLHGMMGGELSNELPAPLLKRSDEMGEIGKDLNDMQAAIRVLVERDSLTGLYNRRYGGARLRKMMQQKEKYGTSCAVCICDIDFFKKVNDTYGHDAGDEVLKRVASILTRGMTGKGFVARWGGEEFLLAFNKVGQDQAAAYLEEILDQIRVAEVHYGAQTIRVTMSFGVADGGPYTDYGPLLNEADARLYYGKQNGRNQVVSTSSEILKAMAEEKKAKEENAKAVLESHQVDEVARAAKKVEALVADAEPGDENMMEGTEKNTASTKEDPDVENLIPSAELAGKMAKEHDMDKNLFNQSELIEQIIQRIGDTLLKEISENDD